MTTAVSPTHAGKHAVLPNDLVRWAVPVGRALFAAIFILASFGHFSKETIGYAAAAGVPLAGIAVPFSGLLALAGGLSVLLGYRTRIGALLLVAFLVPVTLMMHKFWGVADPMMAKMQQVMFMKNVALTGASLLLAWFGAGPISLDAKKGR
jgi:putative oxidoreductase